ncbi:hypothetical protein [Pseudonocardia sp. GCM10023141]|uniref:hypothetical protein n=1 Tax=Pseudonocardia sp. GCM10023141 TaxID=3252653 RepID=UPI00361D4A2E
MIPVLVAGVLALAVTAGLTPAPTPDPPAPVPPARCTVDDPRLEELSGLVVDGDAIWAMADGGSRVTVYRLDVSGPECSIVQTRTAPLDPYDPEDLAIGPDGALWVSDTGDNDRKRDTVAVVVMPATGAAQLHRLSYPDGPHDAEALLVDRQGRPVVIVKDFGVSIGIYRTAAPPEGSGPTPLVRVGALAPPSSQTVGGPVGGFGSRLVTGAASTADGSVVAVRTYTDAWLFPAPDGDPVAALTGEPVQVPLPDEPQGEAIAFTSDGTLLSGSETRGGVSGQIRAVTGASGLVPAARRHAAPAATGSPSAPEAATTPEWVPGVVGGAALVVVLMATGVAMSVRRRR